MLLRSLLFFADAFSCVVCVHCSSSSFQLLRPGLGGKVEPQCKGLRRFLFPIKQLDCVCVCVYVGGIVEFPKDPFWSRATVTVIRKPASVNMYCYSYFSCSQQCSVQAFLKSHFYHFITLFLCLLSLDSIYLLQCILLVILNKLVYTWVYLYKIIQLRHTRTHAWRWSLCKPPGGRINKWKPDSIQMTTAAGISCWHQLLASSAGISCWHHPLIIPKRAGRINTRVSVMMSDFSI